MHGVTKRRKRGRPKGSTRYAQQDAVIMQQAADLMIGDGKLSPTAAIKQATGRPGDDTLIHRLRGKMKRNIEQHLAEARARVERGRRSEAPPTRQSPLSELVGQMGGFMQWTRDAQRLTQTDSFTRQAQEFARLTRPLMQTDSFTKLSQELTRLTRPFPEFDHLKSVFQKFDHIKWPFR